MDAKKEIDKLAEDFQSFQKGSVKMIVFKARVARKEWVCQAAKVSGKRMPS